MVTQGGSTVLNTPDMQSTKTNQCIDCYNISLLSNKIMKGAQAEESQAKQVTTEATRAGALSHLRHL